MWTVEDVGSGQGLGKNGGAFRARIGGTIAKQTVQTPMLWRSVAIRRDPNAQTGRATRGTAFMIFERWPVFLL